jgi:hypothetical protein
VIESPANSLRSILFFAQIKKRTGLDFGKVIRKAYTIARADQPVVGEEALTLIQIQTPSDIVL